MFMNKVFQQKQSISTEDSSVCILQWSYDFEERLLGTAPTVPILSSHISICGLSSEIMEEMCARFGTHKLVYHVQEGYVGWQEPPAPQGDDKDFNYEVTQVSMTKKVTALLSFLCQKEFRIVTSTVDSSAFSGYVNKTYTWTLQK